MRKAELPSVEESEISIAPHDPDWARLYVEEADRVEATFGGRCVAIEHIGSTAVPGLLAKPIVDILVASVDGAAPSVDELEALAAQSYVFLGEDGRRPGRWFWRKRGRVSFNLSLVPRTSDLWRDNLFVRDYLRSHPHEVSQYAEVKRHAIAAAPNSLLGYQNCKREFVTGLSLLTAFGEAVLRGPAPIVVNSKDGRGPAALLAGELNGAFAAEPVVRWTDEGRHGAHSANPRRRLPPAARVRVPAFDSTTRSERT